MSSGKTSLAHVFGNYKAEWLKDRVFELFQRPRYFSELEGNTPVVLEGGRGTGKTTVLRCMEFRGQVRLRKIKESQLGDLSYWGVYYRVDTSRVRAFQGPEIQDWTKVFSHYVNLILLEKLVQMAEWVERSTGVPIVVQERSALAQSLFAEGIGSVSKLSSVVTHLKIDLENYVNNVGSSDAPKISMARAPVEYFIQELQEQQPFQGKPFFVLIDEYENLLDYQQVVWNTFVKHTESPLSYKIGVRPGGRRDRATLGGERLESPADFSLVRVEERLEDEFMEFASRACDERIRQVFPDTAMSIKTLLPGLSLEEEAKELGGDIIANEVREELDRCGLPDIASWPALELLMLKYLSEEDGETIGHVAREAQRAPQMLRNRINNYSFPLLFWINSGKRTRRGGAKRKLYCGVDVIAKISGINIRYFFEIVSRVLTLDESGNDSTLTPIAPSAQTEGCKLVAKKNIDEVEYLSRIGGSLKRLILALGRIFQVMAHDPLGHTPEVTAFIVGGVMSDELRELMSEAITHLVLVRRPSTKPFHAGETKDDEFMLHPVFSSYFEISYRRKRRITLTSEDLLGLVRDTSRTIQEVLDRQRRSPKSTLPDQMELLTGVSETEDDNG